MIHLNPSVICSFTSLFTVKTQVAMDLISVACVVKHLAYSAS